MNEEIKQLIEEHKGIVDKILADFGLTRRIKFELLAESALCRGGGHLYGASGGAGQLSA